MQLRGVRLKMRLVVTFQWVRPLVWAFCRLLEGNSLRRPRRWRRRSRLKLRLQSVMTVGKLIDGLMHSHRRSAKSWLVRTARIVIRLRVQWKACLIVFRVC